MLKFSRCGISLLRNMSASNRLFASTATLTSEKPTAGEAQKQSEKQRTVRSPRVAAVFAALNDDDPTSETSSSSQPTTSKEKIDVDAVISNAKTVNGLLSIADTKGELSRNHALKIVSILAEWSSVDKAKLAEFENDARFVKLCKVLGRSMKQNHQMRSSSVAASSQFLKVPGVHTEDLNVIIGVTGDDEAAKLVAKLTLPQMVKVLKSLAMKKRRSIPLLRSLTFNMSCKMDQLDIKQCGDVLYALATLNYPDPMSIKKVCVDIQEALKAPIKKSATVGSVLTSIALLKYRDTFALDSLTEWMINNQETARIQDLSATVMSLAMLNYTPEGLREKLKTKLIASLTELDFKNSFEFLNYSWSLMSLGFYNEKFFDIVLSDEFLQKIKAECYNNELTPAIKMKLLNINAGVKLFLPNYSGSMLNREKSQEIYDVPLIYNKEKIMIVSALTDSLKSLIPANCQKFGINTNMGFLIDAEFFVDKSGKLSEKETNDGRKIAMIAQDFHDYCNGPHPTPNGISKLCSQLLEKKGYSLIVIPYQEFSHSDKLLRKVQYVEEKIKSLSVK